MTEFVDEEAQKNYDEYLKACKKRAIKPSRSLEQIKGDVIVGLKNKMFSSDTESILIDIDLDGKKIVNNFFFNGFWYLIFDDNLCLAIPMHPGTQINKANKKDLKHYFELLEEEGKAKIILNPDSEKSKIRNVIDSIDL